VRCVPLVIAPLFSCGAAFANEIREFNDFCSMKITEDVRKYAAEQGMPGDQALQASMEQKSREFSETGAEICSKA
jgi:hypothetical protein